jgi:hypothetical protein
MERPINKPSVVGEFLRQCDCFGHPITFTYKRYPEYRSKQGGLISLSVFIGMLIYSIVIFKETVKREVYTVTSSTTKRDLFFENTTLSLIKDNFDIAYMLSGIKNKTVMDNIQEYLSIFFLKSHYEYLLDPVE